MQIARRSEYAWVRGSQNLTQWVVHQGRRNEFEMEGGGHRSEAKVGGTDPETIFLVVLLHFLAVKAQLVVLVSAFVMVSTVSLVSCLLFFYSRCPVPSHL